MEGGNIFEHINPPQQNHPQNPPLVNQPLRPRTLGEYSQPSHQGYRNTIELARANVLPLRSDTIRLVQSGCAFRGLRSEDPNQHLKDFLKIVDSIDLDVTTRESTQLRLLQFSLRDQASQWLERLPAGSIISWDDLTTRFLAQFFPPGRTTKLRNEILMFQQRQGETLYEAWTRFKDLLHKVPHHDLWLQVQIFYYHIDLSTRRTIDQSAGGKLHDLSVEESWELIEDLALYDNESWNDPRDLNKTVKAISLPSNKYSTPDRRIMELEDQVKFLMKSYEAPKPSSQVNKITSSCELCSGPHDTRDCVELPETAFADYASSRTDEAGDKWYTFKPEPNPYGDSYNPSWKNHLNLRWKQNQNNSSNPPNRYQPNVPPSNRTFNNNPSNNYGSTNNIEGLMSKFMVSQEARISKFEANFKQKQSEMTIKIETLLKVLNDRDMGALPSDTVKNPKLNVNSISSVSSPTSCPQYYSVKSTSMCFKQNQILQKDQSNRTPDIEPVKSIVETLLTQDLDDEFKELHLERPVIDVLARAPYYSALLGNYENFKLGKNGTAFVQNKLPKKLYDSGIFVLPCKIGRSNAFDTLADLGSSLNLIPLSLFTTLKLGKLEETEVLIGLVDGSIAHPVGMIKDVVFHVGKLTILADFHVLDMISDTTCPLLVGRGFLATASAMIDCKESKIAVGEGDTWLVYDVTKHSYDCEEEPTPHWVEMNRRPSRYGP
jgi:hypothetical protein